MCVTVSRNRLSKISLYVVYILDGNVFDKSLVKMDTFLYLIMFTDNVYVIVKSNKNTG